MSIAFQHVQSAHCESGVASNLLNYHGLKLSEPLTFGIGSGLFFGHMPFLKVNGIPATTYRIFPGLIFKRLCNRLGIKMQTETFRSQASAMEKLDRILDTGKPVGVITSVYYLPYLPEALRFHFNAHNLVVYGKKNGKYLVSDPVLEEVAEIEPADLQRARFAKGALAPNGKMYYPISIPAQVDLRKPVIDGLKKTAFDMTSIPVPLFGVRGERFLAKRLSQYPKKLDERRSLLFLGNIVRMQEEIGTGGAGFRFLFAAFLQEASRILDNHTLFDVSKEMTTVGDQWRAFAYAAGRICKNRAGSGEDFQMLSRTMMECADAEEDIFRRLRKLSLS